MQKSTYHIPRMDCPSEESMVRMKLQGRQGIERLSFDLEGRRLDVLHEGPPEPLSAALADLGLGARLESSVPVDPAVVSPGGEATAGPAALDRATPGPATIGPAAPGVPGGGAEAAQRRLLWSVLAINFGFFIVEVTAGILAQSMGLVADSLDMLADAIVYALSLWAVGGALARKKRVATLSGFFQMALAILGLTEVIRRFVGSEATPDFRTMIVVSLLALVGNSVCLYLLQKSRKEEAHIKASMIFTSNDVIINSGVIVAGVLVLITESKYPDLIVGAIVFVIVILGAFRILKLGR